VRRAASLWGNVLIPILLASAAYAQVDLAASDNDHVTIRIDGQPFSTFYIGTAYAKPFLAPLRSADGRIVTRRFPMERVEGESRDHPHHKGLWIGYGDINGINFWETEAESRPSPENPQTKGTIRLVRLGEVQSGKKSGSVTAEFAWDGPQKTPILAETRTLTFYADDKIRRLDVDTNLTAQTDVRFGDTKEGFFAIRVADSMSGKNGGIMTNSEGEHTEKDVWGKRADWVDYVGTVDGQKTGILILDNPANPNHPPRWHARDYGLFAVNPFGIKEFDPKSAEHGGFHIAKGATAEFRYRVIIHPGDSSKKDIVHWYSEYAKSGK
jgi:hypothetical protein